MITYISGGERSGKSSYAQSKALELSNNPIYLATAKIWDDDFEERVKRHKDDRDDRWTSIEEEIHLSRVLKDDQVTVIDCITLWLSNIYAKHKYNRDLSFSEAKEEFNKLTNYQGHLIIISNEIGMGVHADSKMGRDFVELQGWTNQMIAQSAQEAYFIVSGLPIKIK